MTQVQAGPLAPFVAQVARAEGLARVRLIGELDVAAAPRAEAAIARAEQRQPPTLELDLSALAFMDSTGLRLMLGARERALDAGRTLLLRRGPFAVQRVFEVTSLVTLFEFVD
ncbi:MAG: STAS domain-containing protein [Actinobacteria bacterium]|nr:STAS domain-containing protein [Actinomycetota bacterium]